MHLIVALWLACQDGGVVSGKVTVPEAATQKKTRLKLRYAGQTGLGEKKDPSPSPAVVYLEGAPSGKAEGKVEEIRQEGLEFRPRVLSVQVGTTVRFPNGDSLYHNVFSYSQPKRFDLGRYDKGESREVTFDRKGRVDVFCEIHEHMRAFVIVVDSPHHAVARPDGTYALPKAPPGTYTLVAWHESFEPVRQEVEVTASGAKVDLRFTRAAQAPPATAVACCPKP